MGTIFESFFRYTFNMLRVTLLFAFVAGALSAAILPEDAGFLPSAPPAVEKILEEFYFPNSPLSPEELELIKVEYKMADADGIAVKFRMTFQVVGQDETCKVQVFEQKVWGKTARYLQFDLCKRFAVHSEDAASLYGGGWGHADLADKNANALLEEFYFPSSVLGAEDLELTHIEHQVVAGMNYRYHFNVVGTNAQCQVTIFEQSWTNTREVILDTCASAASKRAIVPYDGNWGEAELDESAAALLEEFYFPSTNILAEDLELIKFERQVVSGMNYLFHFNVKGTNAQCQVLIYEQSWTGIRQIIRDTCVSVNRDATPYTGGWGIMKDLAKLTALLEEFYYPGSIVGAEDLELTSAQHQVVDGFNYRMFFQVVGTNSQCVIEVYEHWTGETHITKDTCAIVVSDRNNNAALLGMDGGWQEADANDFEAVSLLNEVYYPQSVGEEYLTLIKVDKQVVSGTNYKYTFQIGKHGVTCYAIVYTQPWTNTKKVTVDTCLM